MIQASALLDLLKTDDLAVNALIGFAVLIAVTLGVFGFLVVKSMKKAPRRQQ